MQIKTTKTILLSLIVLLTILMFIQACEKGKDANLIGTHTLNLAKTTVALDQGRKADITFTEVLNNSLCPPNVQCVWQGYATTTLKFKDDSKEQSMILCVGACNIVSKPTEQSIVLNEVTYHIKLAEFTPSTDPNKTDESKVKIVITN